MMDSFSAPFAHFFSSLPVYKLKQWSAQDFKPWPSSLFYFHSFSRWFQPPSRTLDSYLTACLIFLLDYPKGFPTCIPNETSNISILLKLTPPAAWPVFVESNAIFSVSQTGNLGLTLISLTSYLSLKFHIQTTSKTYRLRFQNIQNPSIFSPLLLALWSKLPSFLFWIIAIASKLISSWASIPQTATRVILPLYHSSIHNPFLASLLIVWKQKSA